MPIEQSTPNPQNRELRGGYPIRFSDSRVYEAELTQLDSESSDARTIRALLARVLALRARAPGKGPPFLSLDASETSKDDPCRLIKHLGRLCSSRTRLRSKREPRRFACWRGGGGARQGAARARRGRPSPRPRQPPGAAAGTPSPRGACHSLQAYLLFCLSTKSDNQCSLQYQHGSFYQHA